MSHDLGHVLTGGIKLAVKFGAKAINSRPVTVDASSAASIAAKRA